MCISKLFVAEDVRGLEYAEQLHLSPHDLNSLPDHSFEYVDFLHVYRHWKLGQVRERPSEVIPESVVIEVT